MLEQTKRARVVNLWEGCVMFPDTSYDPDTLALLTRAFDDAWKDVQSALVVKPLAADVLRRALSR